MHMKLTFIACDKWKMAYLGLSKWVNRPIWIIAIHGSIFKVYHGVCCDKDVPSKVSLK
jgi:hypothetical protein